MYARALLFLAFSCLPLRSADWVTYPGGQGPGAGKHIVFLTGDEEYRSEEGMPMMARMLAERAQPAALRSASDSASPG